MAKDKLHKLPARDPVTGGELYISEVANDETGITIRGKFEVPVYARLDHDQQKFLETFLRCRGMLNSVERELGISYPTARARLDSLLESLGMKSPELREDVQNGTQRKEKATEKKRKILEMLERGEITAEEAKEKLGVAR
jgi:hypothetical protein